MNSADERGDVKGGGGERSKNLSIEALHKNFKLILLFKKGA